MPDDRPNILLIYTDQQRFDTLGCNGNALIRTPHLDRLAATGVRFRQAYVNCPLCVPSRVSLFTGRRATNTGSINNGILLRPDQADFATALRQAGYTTALIGKDHCFGDERRPQAFEHVRRAGHCGIDADLSERAAEIGAHRHDTMYRPLGDDPIPPEHNITGSLGRAAHDFIAEQRAGKPWFLWLSIPDPHPPYMVCEPYASMYDEVDVPLPATRPGEMANKPDRQRLIAESGSCRRHYPDDDALRRLRRTYWGMVSYVDAQVGRLLTALGDSGQDQNTIVVFTADHGDYLGDHQMIRKGPHLYQALTHVPLLMRVPGGAHDLATDALVSNIDLMPTLAEFAGLEPPAATDGRSFATVLRGVDTAHRQHVVLEHGNPGTALRQATMSVEAWEELQQRPAHHLCREICAGRTRGLVTRRWKYCKTEGDVAELYDLATDPHELTNLAGDPEQRLLLADLAKRLHAAT